MQLYINIAIIVVAVALVAAVLFQAKGGGGLGGILTDSGTVFRTKRGIEKTLFQFTIALSVLFIALSIIALKLV
jgi:preprotein translocase subunit SecG